MEQSPSWEANSHWANQESPFPLLWNPKFHYHVHRSPPLGSLLSQMHPVLKFHCFPQTSYPFSITQYFEPFFGLHNEKLQDDYDDYVTGSDRDIIWTLFWNVLGRLSKVPITLSRDSLYSGQESNCESLTVGVPSATLWLSVLVTEFWRVEGRLKLLCLGFHLIQFITPFIFLLCFVSFLSRCQSYTRNYSN
jgi:hypothetical protein